ncbi:hypothetical protein [Paraburkholderia bannensis]|uniref:hypothetical protein n=1 Tax=Paraburkholderia bannensis TaxID=765414 RepID=UPI002AB614E1|nr:hypothetical protein [Paraburkholderia bannensis]
MSTVTEEVEAVRARVKPVLAASTDPVQAAPARMAAATESIDQLLNTALPGFGESAVALEKRRLAAPRVDGRIIGTGEADFTKGNTVYALNHEGKTFQLLDVPGIEGDESRYAAMVEEAVKTAHLVVYVNGTNKKPEKATAEKIRSYLRWGTQVYPLVNVRGNADAYEFDEDRESLESHGGAGDALKQTVGVLEAVLPEGVLLKGNCVQGLLGFSALAVDAATGRTTIHPSRDRDLVIQQRNYRKHFASHKAMFEFSQLGAVAKQVDAKLLTFREDIVESNKMKVRQLLAANIDELQAALADHRRFMADILPSFKDCRDLIESSLSNFERLLGNGFSNRWAEFFNGLSERANDIVAENFGENDVISAQLKRASTQLQATVGDDLQAHLQGLLKELEQRAGEAMRRLMSDVQRLQFLQEMKVAASSGGAAFRAGEMDMSLSLKEWGGMAFNVASYAITGAMIGSAFPVIGNLIGAAVGALVGVLVSVAGFFMGKEKRIRKAQQQVQDKIADMRRDVMNTLPEEAAKITRSIRSEMTASVLAQVDALYATLARPIAVIEQQIAAMSKIKNQLEKMPHGTIQAIQR